MNCSIARATRWRSLPAERRMSSSSVPAGVSTILHIGLGSFHRAHQAVYLHHLREAGDASWSIVGGAIRDALLGHPHPCNLHAMRSARKAEGLPMLR